MPSTLGPILTGIGPCDNPVGRHPVGSARGGWIAFAHVKDAPMVIRVNEMPLVNCPECGRQVSTEAEACPNCGFPVAQRISASERMPDDVPGTEVLLEARPSWWRFFWHLVFCWLIIPWLVALWRRASVVLRVYPGRIMLERGVFSKYYREFMINDIRAVDIDQNFLSRLVGIGDLTISTAATVDAAERIEGIPDPMAVRELILSQRKEGD